MPSLIAAASPDTTTAVFFTDSKPSPQPQQQQRSSKAASSSSSKGASMEVVPLQRYTFAHGCLGGHLLAGEESFAVEWNKKDDSVWWVHSAPGS